MTDLETQLKRALRPEQPSPDFTDRVMARIAEENRAQAPAAPARDLWTRLREFFQPSQMKWGMVAAMACLLLFASLGVHRYREHQRALEIAEGEKAREQVLLALRIASSKLNVAQKKIQDNHER